MQIKIDLFTIYHRLAEKEEKKSKEEEENKEKEENKVVAEETFITELQQCPKVVVSFVEFYFQPRISVWNGWLYMDV